MLVTRHRGASAEGPLAERVPQSIMKWPLCQAQTSPTGIFCR